ncbi:MAG: right-handed parallel beta-helix repeat-containing protein [Clostridiales bacterium]|nr:right-handed parallel beta-helix repeat-containing protein [Clostridiales bacterium]
MAKKIRFSLEMSEGVMVGSVEALRENFSLPQVLMYLSNGKLITWLKDRYEDDLADAIEKLDKEDPELAKKICNIFDVEYSEQEEINLEKAMERNRKLKILKEYTSEQKVIAHVDQVAFTQDDLYDLLDEEESEIYLCGERFSIPLGKTNMKYYGINKPTVIIDSKNIVDWKQKNILLENVNYDDKYQSIVSKEDAKENLNFPNKSKIEHVFAEQPITKSMKLDGEIKNNDKIIDPKNLQEELISEQTQIGSDEKKYYKYKNIHIVGSVYCSGTLEFDHCIINYNEFGAGMIELVGGSNLKITNSVVICKGVHGRSLFGNDMIGIVDNVIIDRTDFVDCSFFFDCNVRESFTLMNCNMKNCSAGFIKIYAGRNVTKIKNNTIVQNDLSAFNKMYIVSNGYVDCCLIDIQSGLHYDEKQHVDFCNNYIEEDSHFREMLFTVTSKADYSFQYICGGTSAKVLNCTFKGISSRIEAAIVKNCKFQNCLEGVVLGDRINANGFEALIDNCIFKNCTRIITVYRDTRISNCQFISCYDELIESSRHGKGGVTIDNCQFFNIKYSGEYGENENKASIVLSRDGKSSSNSNFIRNCIFDGAELNAAFLIKARDNEYEPYGTVIFIENCNFKNCTTKRQSGKIIKEYLRHYPLIGKKAKYFHANEIQNCTGLDKINKEGFRKELVEIKTRSTSGELIGYTAKN